MLTRSRDILSYFVRNIHSDVHLHCHVQVAIFEFGPLDLRDMHVGKTLQVTLFVYTHLAAGTARQSSVPCLGITIGMNCK